MKNVLTGAVLAFVFARSGAAQSLTLRDAVDEALSKNPAIAAADARQQAAAAREAEARAGRFPLIDVSESATRGNNPVFVFGSLLEQGRFAPRHFDPVFLNAPPAMTNYRSSITARFAIFDRFRTSTAAGQGANGVDRASLELDDARQRIRADVVARYYGVLVAGEKVAVTKEAVGAAEADAKAARDRFEQGLLVESDALSADVQVATLRQRLIAAEGEQAIARAALATLLQRPRRDDVSIAGTIPSTLPASAQNEPDLDAAIAHALASRAPVRIAALAASDAQLRLTAERGTALPRVDAVGTAGASGATFGRRNSDYTGAIAVTIDLFDRARPARIAEARAGIDAARAGDTMARDAVTMEVITAWQRLRTARESASVAAAAVEQAQAAARIVRDRYEHGLTTITEQLRAQTALVSARFELLAARYESVVAHAELLRATGDLNDVQPFI
ncbi:MAG TPA: TolC family protein [Thermoanaerobaculia bacterium]